MAMISDSLPSERRGMGFGIIMLITSTSTTPGPCRSPPLQPVRNGVGHENSVRHCRYPFLIASVLRFRLKETFIDTPKPSWKEFFRSYPTSLRESVRVWKRVPSSMFYLFLTRSDHDVWSCGRADLSSGLRGECSSVDATVWAYVLLALPITMIVFSIPIGKFVDKINRKMPILASYGFFFFSLLFFVSGWSVSLLFLALVFLRSWTRHDELWI